MKLDLVIFDFDGTLIDSEPGIRKAIEMTVAALNLPLEAVEHWVQMIGIPLEVQLSHLLPLDRHGEIEAGVALYRQFYDQVGPQHSDPIPGIKPLIDWLHPRLPMAIASSKQRQAITRVLDQWQWPARFHPIISPTEVIHPKPHPESIHKVLESHSVSPEQVLMIGDSIYDIEMAQRAGVLAWGVAWGVHTEDRLQQAGAEQVFSDPQDLLVRLQEI